MERRVGSRRLGLLMLACLSLAGCAPTPGPEPGRRREIEEGTDMLRELEWQARPIVLFAPSDDDPSLVEARAAIAAATAGLDERQMVCIEVLADEVRQGERRAGAGQAAELRTRFRIENTQFVAILVGKDGGEKDRVEQLDRLEPWFARVDAMPMRRREMRQSSDEGTER